jgi:hypothetical protein
MRNSGVITPFTKGLSRNVIDNAYKEMGLRPV